MQLQALNFHSVLLACPILLISLKRFQSFKQDEDERKVWLKEKNLEIFLINLDFPKMSRS